MKIISWNINGIKSLIKEGFFEELIIKECPDILCLQEKGVQILEKNVKIKFEKRKIYVIIKKLFVPSNLWTSIS